MLKREYLSVQELKAEGKRRQREQEVLQQKIERIGSVSEVKNQRIQELARLEMELLERIGRTRSVERDVS